jgi:hypothetical protein
MTQYRITAAQTCFARGEENADSAVPSCVMLTTNLNGTRNRDSSCHVKDVRQTLTVSRVASKETENFDLELVPAAGTFANQMN